MGFGQAAAGGAADLHRLELLAVLDAAADVIDDLAERGAHRDLDEAGVHDVTGQGKGLGAGAAIGTDGTEPRRALLDDVGDVCEGFDVVEAGGPAEEAFIHASGRFGARHAAVAFNGRRHGGAFAADKGARAAVDVHVEALAAAENVVTDQAEFFRLLNGDSQAVHRQRVFRTDIDVALGGIRRHTGYDHAFENLVRVAFHAGTVHEGTGVALVAVADDVLDRLFLVCRNLGPLFTGREAGAAAPAQAGVGHFLNDLFPAQFKQALGKSGITPDGKILFDAFGVDVTAVLQHAAGLLLIERDVLLALVKLTVLVIAEAFDKLAADQGLFNDLLHIRNFYLGVQPAFRLDAHQRAHFAEAVAAGFFEAGHGAAAFGEVEGDFTGNALRIHLGLQFVKDLEVPACRAAGTAADQHFALLVFTGADACFLQGFEFFEVADSLSHPSGLPSQLRHQRSGLFRRHRRMNGFIHHDDRTQPAGTEAGDDLQGEQAVVRGGFVFISSCGIIECLQHRAALADMACRAAADFQDILALCIQGKVPVKSCHAIEF